VEFGNKKKGATFPDYSHSFEYSFFIKLSIMRQKKYSLDKIKKGAILPKNKLAQIKGGSNSVDIIIIDGHVI